MENKQKNSPLFAEVNIRQEKEEKRNIARRQSRQNTTYFKLTYPNGVTMVLPSTTNAEVLEKLIRIKF